MEYVKITDPEVSLSVHRLMLSQGHYVPHMTHVFMEGDALRGAFSEVWLPTVFLWFNLDDLHPITSVRMFKYVRDVIAPSKGHKRLLWVIPENVEAFKHTERIGLTAGGCCHWFMSGSIT